MQQERRTAAAGGALRRAARRCARGLHGGVSATAGDKAGCVTGESACCRMAVGAWQTGARRVALQRQLNPHVHDGPQRLTTYKLAQAELLNTSYALTLLPPTPLPHHLPHHCTCSKSCAETEPRAAGHDGTSEPSLSLTHSRRMQRLQLILNRTCTNGTLHFCTRAAPSVHPATCQ